LAPWTAEQVVSELVPVAIANPVVAG
jgi:hypothetical protein